MESWRAQPVVFWAFLLPGALWLLGFFLVPLALVWVLSFGESAGPVDILITWTLDNYARALDPLYLGLFWKSIWIAALATAITLVIGLPVALAVSFAPPRAKPLLLILVILPFWTNLLIRTYAMIAVLRSRGYVNLGLDELWQLLSDVAGLLFGQPLPRFTPLPLLYNDAAVVVGIVYVYLPFMVLPCTPPSSGSTGAISRRAWISAPASCARSSASSCRSRGRASSLASSWCSSRLWAPS